MACVPKTAYLDGVAFAINPVFVINERKVYDPLVDFELALALSYDLKKAHYLTECKYDLETEKALISTQDDDDDEELKQQKKQHRQHQRVKSSSKHKSKRIESADKVQPMGDEDADDEDDRWSRNRSKTTSSRSRRHQAGGGRSQRSMSSHNVLEASTPLDEMATDESSLVDSADPSRTVLSSSLSSYSYPIETAFNPAGDLMANSKRNKWLDHHPPHFLIPPAAVPSAQPQQPPPPPAPSATSNNNFYFLNHPFNISVSSLLEPTVNQAVNKTVSKPKDDINNNVATSATAATNHSIASNATSAAQKTAAAKKYSSLIDEDDLINTRSSLDPFHDMELKTINDFEELKNILTNHQAQQVHQPPPPPVAAAAAAGAFGPLHFGNGGGFGLQPLPSAATVHGGRNGDGAMLMDNFGLPKISFVDLDLNNKT